MVEICNATKIEPEKKIKMLMEMVALEGGTAPAPKGVLECPSSGNFQEWHEALFTKGGEMVVVQKRIFLESDDPRVRIVFDLLKHCYH